MGRKVFAPGVKTRSIQIDALAKARSEGALDRLLARPARRSDRLAVWLTHHVYRNPPLPGGSALGDNEPVVRNYGFQPLTSLIMHTWYAEQVGVECWVDPTGKIVLEVVREDTSTIFGAKHGLRLLVAYFTDGTSLVMWDQDANLDALATPTRESMLSSGYFPQDMRDFTARIAALEASGREVLRAWNVASLVRRYELHGRYMMSRGAREAEKVHAMAGFIVMLVSLLLMALLVGWINTWSMGAAMAAGFATSKICRRLGLYLRFDIWLYNRFGI